MSVSCCLRRPTLQALTAQNGEALARSILSMSEAHTCAHPEQFVVALKDMFAAIDPERIRTRTGEVLQDMIEQLRQHEVSGSRGRPGGGGGRVGGGRAEEGGAWACRLLPVPAAVSTVVWGQLLS